MKAQFSTSGNQSDFSGYRYWVTLSFAETSLKP